MKQGSTGPEAAHCNHQERGQHVQKAAPQEVLASDDGRVVGIHHNSAERSGKHLESGCCIVFQVRDGRILSGREHFYDLHKWDQLWQ